MASIPKDEVALYGGFEGLPGEVHRTQRNWVVHATVLDGDAGGAVVRFEIPAARSFMRPICRPTPAS